MESRPSLINATCLLDRGGIPPSDLAVPNPTGCLQRINVQNSTSNLDLVGTQLMGMKWQQGSTNMAQELTLADATPSQGGQPHAQCTVLLLSNGKYSCKYQTELGTAACTPAELDDFFDGIGSLAASTPGSSYVHSEAKQSYVTAVLYILPWSTCTLTPVVVEALQVPTSSSQCDLCLVHSLNTKCGRKCQRWRLPAALPGLLAQGGVPHGPGGL